MTDARLQAFLSSPVEVFNSVAAVSEVWTYDPLDVKEIHQKARGVFERLVNRAAERRAPPDGGEPTLSEPGRVLLLTGQAGCGKTHLLRAFRNSVHSDGRGFVGYLQLTTTGTNYARYILSNLIDSLSQPYNELRGPTTGLAQLAKVLAKSCETPEIRERLLSPDEYDPAEVRDAVEGALAQIARFPRYRNIDLNLLRALLFLHSRDQLTMMRVMRYLRCEPLTPADSAALGNIATAPAEEAPERMLQQLGELIRSTGRCLVICVDQLEGAVDEQVPADAFRRLMQTLTNLASQVASSVFVVACLSDFYDAMRPHLTRSIVDRVELNPPRQNLEELCTADEAEWLVGARLRHLYALSGVRGADTDPLYPFKRDDIRKLAGRRTRDVILACLRHRQRAQDLGHLPPELADTPPPAPSVLPAVHDPAVASELKWSEFHARWSEGPSPDDEDQARILHEAIQSCDRELESRVEATRTGAVIEIRVVKGGATREMVLQVSNRAPQGGHLARTVDALEKLAKGRVALLARATEVKRGQKTVIGPRLDAFEKRGGRVIVVQNADFRAMLALRAFEQQFPQIANQPEWRRKHRPLLRLPSMQAIFLPSGPPPTQTKLFSSSSHSTIPPAPASPSARSLHVGTLLAARSPVALGADSLCRHAVFLGSAGSGKTTLALAMVEQLLLADIPAILVDRKGDLAVYAQESAWSRELLDPALAERRQRLRERIDVSLFTPGLASGRNLIISPLPTGLATLPPDEREVATDTAAQALAGMLKLKASARDEAMRALLIEAVKTLVEAKADQVDLETLIEWIQTRPPTLLEAARAIDRVLFKELVQRLASLRITAKALLSGEGESLDIELLLGRGKHEVKGKTRLSVVSTKFLADPDHVQLWVSQLLMELSRWSSRNPQGALQAVVLFDEADIYLPALSKPPTKAPMENLLKRARSAGLGLLLATQSPGDFDYRCRDQLNTRFIGAVRETTALEKLRPILTSTAEHLVIRIAHQMPGEFLFVVDGKSAAISGARSCLAPEQLPEGDLPRLAAETRP